MLLGDQVFFKLTLKYVAKRWTCLSILKFMVWVGVLDIIMENLVYIALSVGLINLHYAFKTMI